jgi:hypothetical protein
MIHEDRDGNQYAFVPLPRAMFPFTIEYFSIDDSNGSQPLFTSVVESPGALKVPPLATAIGRPVWVRTTYATGETDEAWPDER